MDNSLKPRRFETIFFGALAIGILDGIFALIIYGLILGASALRMFQSIAAGLLGREAAFSGGIRTFLLGVFLHFSVAAVIAAVYYAASLKLKFLIENAVLCGLIYGMIAFLVMNYVVIPLSRAGSGAMPLSIFLAGIIGHAFLVGLPVALIARRSAMKYL